MHYDVYKILEKLNLDFRMFRTMFNFKVDYRFGLTLIESTDENLARLNMINKIIDYIKILKKNITPEQLVLIFQNGEIDIDNYENKLNLLSYTKIGYKDIGWKCCVECAVKDYENYINRKSYPAHSPELS